jgi:hypothetical protein
MSENWIRRKMVELKERYPGEVIYQKIDPFIEASAYRAVLWNLKVEKDALNISLSKLISKGGVVDISGALGTDVEVLSAPIANGVKLSSPRNKFEEQVLSWYEDELAMSAKVIYK